MCGIAGVVDLAGQREVDPAVVAQMAGAIIHRGPDEEGFHFSPGVGLASRRLSIVGLADGQQPIYNEDRTVCVVFNGELFDFREVRADLERRGHVFRTHCDTEIIVHLWEEHGEAMFERLRGQFALALIDFKRQVMILGRDRVGICPLHWARRGDWLYFGSEIKAILASGQVDAEADLRGLDNIMTFFAMPGRRTMFKGISAVYPGTFLKIRWRQAGSIADVTEHRYWDLDFPAQGEEDDPADPTALIEEFRATFNRAVDLRLQADVPVVSYLSGGIDSAAVLVAASKIVGRPIPSFTIKIAARGYDETDRAMQAARLAGSRPTVVHCDGPTLSAVYPKLIEAADCPVIDTACAALYCLAAEVHRQGYKVALTGEGADEALAGYPWFKVNRLTHLFDVGAFRPSSPIRWAVHRLVAHRAPFSDMRDVEKFVGGRFAPMDLYHLMRSTRRWLYRDEILEELEDYMPAQELDLDHDRMKRWAPLNQSLYVGYKTILPGLLMNHKGDRVAMASSVETRYPFLDEDFISLCARVHPRWKLKGLLRDKHLFRTASEGLLPPEITNRPKAMFRAPFGDTMLQRSSPFIDQLLSRESLAATGYFDVEEVLATRAALGRRGWFPARKLFAEMGMTAVVSTQLWHHLYLGGGLCELPAWSPPVADAVPATR
jgi:asparagine synthase (glutamine-hydrolysing)